MPETPSLSTDQMAALVELARQGSLRHLHRSQVDLGKVAGWCSVVITGGDTLKPGDGKGAGRQGQHNTGEPKPAQRKPVQK